MGALKINHGAVWLNIVLLHVLGFLWYGPVFGEIWMELEGLTMASIEANPPGAGVWITNFIASVLPVYVLAWLFVKLEVTTWLDGAKYAFIIAFSVNFMSIMTSDMFAFEPYTLSWITGGFNLFGLTLTGIILGAWTKQEPE